MKIWRFLQSSWKCVACYSINYNIRHQVKTSKGKRNVCFLYTPVGVDRSWGCKKLVGISWETFHKSSHIRPPDVSVQCVITVCLCGLQLQSVFPQGDTPACLTWLNDACFCLLFFYGISCQDKTRCLTSHLKHAWHPNYKNQPSFIDACLILSLELTWALVDRTNYLICVCT